MIFCWNTSYKEYHLDFFMELLDRTFRTFSLKTSVQWKWNWACMCFQSVYVKKNYTVLEATLVIIWSLLWIQKIPSPLFLHAANKWRNCSSFDYNRISWTVILEKRHDRKSQLRTMEIGVKLFRKCYLVTRIVCQLIYFSWNDINKKIPFLKKLTMSCSRPPRENWFRRHNRKKRWVIKAGIHGLKEIGWAKNKMFPLISTY